MDDLDRIYKFKDNKWNIWKTHPSHSFNQYFQKMEFFGDKLLSFCITLFLMEKNLNESEMSNYLSQLVRTETLAKIAEQYLLKDIKYKGQINQSMLADCCEVFIACVYYDGGNIQEVIYQLWKNLLNKKYQSSYKNLAQELLQAKNIQFEYLYEENPDGFICKLVIGDDVYEDYAKSKKESSEKAAKKFLETIDYKKNTIKNKKAKNTKFSDIN